MCSRSLFRSFLRRGLFLFGSLAVFLLVVLLPLSASADTIHLNPTYGDSSKNSLVAQLPSDVSLVNRLEQQYSYGGLYNPLILVDSRSFTWSYFKVSVFYSFGRSLPAGTVLSISCGGWFSKSYALTESPSMYVSTSNPWLSSIDWNGSKQLLERSFSSVDDYIQSSNGNYRGLLYHGSYTLPVQSDGVWLTFYGTIRQRSGGCYVGISCSDISYQGNVLVDGSYPGFEGETSAFTDYEQQESALMEDIDIPGALDNLNEHKVQSDSLMRQLLGSFQAISALFLKMSVKLPEFYILASVSFSIGIFCALVGIAQGLYRSHIRFVREKRRTINAQAREAAKFNIRVTKTKTVGDPETGVRTTFSRRVK